MSTLAIVGAGPELGIATAERFAREGYVVALIDKCRDELATLVDSLAARGFAARAYQADPHNASSLASALAAVAKELGAVEVLQYSHPVPRGSAPTALPGTAHARPVNPDHTTVGVASTIQQVLPAMRQAARGTILIVEKTRDPTWDAGTADLPAASVYAERLHHALAPHNIHVGQLIVRGEVGRGGPTLAPEALAERLWTIHKWRGPFRTTVSARPELPSAEVKPHLSALEVSGIERIRVPPNQTVSDEASEAHAKRSTGCRLCS